MCQEFWIYQVVLGHQQGQWDQTNQGSRQGPEAQRDPEVQGWPQYQSPLGTMKKEAKINKSVQYFKN